MSELDVDLTMPEGRYKMMFLIRRFETKIKDLFERGSITGTAHLCIGQEAAAVGAVSASRTDDPIVSSHRGHGHFLARTGAPSDLMAEMMGRISGPCKGRGGSQHLCDIGRSFYGTNGITGGGIPTATGLGLRQVKTGGGGRAVLCFFGDGATNQGTFHESLNMAAIWNLPVVYICENNLYAMSTPVKDSMEIEHVAHRASAYSMPGESVDGMDVEAVREAVSEALHKARHGAGPTLIEARCYRFCGHSRSDQRAYRTREEEECWESVDPLRVERLRLNKTGTSEKTLKKWENHLNEIIEEAYASARNAPRPDRSQVIVSPYHESQNAS
ncbi:MAG: thiamine pyrophosphate-dependent dehydrogenase E1 component subunit alpha [Planctomycetota bacterium]